MRKKITLLNITSSIILQVVTIISGFIIPRLVLSYFGSQANGLVSSLNQFLNYISLIEGGITSVVAANLYKPLLKHDEEKISSIYNTANSFYKKIGFIYIGYSLIIGIFYPILVNTDFSYSYIFCLTIILSIKLLVQYMFSLSYRTLITSDKKGYIISFTQTILLVINILLAYISINIYPNIHILYLLTGILYIFQPIIFGIFVKKHYKIDKKVAKDKKILSQRWNGFAINLAAFIHFCTDISILTFFTDLATVSIYSVYALVTNGLRQIINSVSSAIVPTIGQAYASDNSEEINVKIDLYEYIMFILVFYFFVVAGLLITPFVMIYTSGITDVNYNQPLFGILLLLSEAFYLIKFPHLNLAYAANKFREITIPSFIEAGINIIISILLVNKFGICGIAIGTVIAMLYRMIFHISYTKKIIGRKQIIFYKKMLIFSIGTAIGLGISYFLISNVEYNILSFIIHGIIYLIIFGIIYLIISLIFYKKELKYFIKYMKH